MTLKVTSNILQINESDFEEYLQKFIFTFYQILCTISTLSNFCKNATK